MPAEMIKRRLLLGDGHWPFFALFPFAPVAGCETKEKWRKRERKRDGAESIPLVRVER